jgi:hypothetical protein
MIWIGSSGGLDKGVRVPWSVGWPPPGNPSVKNDLCHVIQEKCLQEIALSLQTRLNITFQVQELRLLSWKNSSFHLSWVATLRRRKSLLNRLYGDMSLAGKPNHRQRGCWASVEVKACCENTSWNSAIEGHLCIREMVVGRACCSKIGTSRLSGLRLPLT